MCLDHYDEIYLSVSSWLKEQNALQNPRKALVNENGFLKLLKEFKKLDDCDPVELSLIAGFCALGPQNAGPPPAEVYNELLGLVRSMPIEEQKSRWLEVVVAYGTGGWPIITGDPLRNNPWENRRWDRAYRWLREEVKSWIEQSFKWLKKNVKSFEDVIQSAWQEPDRRRDPIRQGIDLLAHEIMYRLIDNECDCYTLEGGRVTSLQRKKRIKRHNLEHNLASWNPATTSLWNFIAQAVKGERPKKEEKGKKDRRVFLSGGFVKGILYTILHRNDKIKLRLGEVLHKYCRYHEKPYEGDRCPYCKKIHFDETVEARITRRLIVVPVSNNGPYMEEPWWQCKPCRNYYMGDPWWQCELKNYYPANHCRPKISGGGIAHGNEHDKCLLCSKKHALRPAWVYVRQFGETHIPLYPEDKIGAESIEGLVVHQAETVAEAKQFSRPLVFESADEPLTCTVDVDIAEDQKTVELTFESRDETFNDQWISFNLAQQDTGRNALSGVALLHPMGGVYEGRYYLRNFSVKSACSLNFGRIDAELLTGSDSKMIANSYRATDEINRGFWKRWLEQRKERPFRHPAFKGVYEMLDAQKWDLAMAPDIF